LAFVQVSMCFREGVFPPARSLRERGEKCNDVSRKRRLQPLLCPAQFVQPRIEPGHARPRAAMYFELFKELHKSPLPGWEIVQKPRITRHCNSFVTNGG